MQEERFELSKALSHRISQKLYQKQLFKKVVSKVFGNLPFCEKGSFDETFSEKGFLSPAPLTAWVPLL